MKLYSFYRSSAAYRVRIGLLLKELPYEYVAKHFKRNGGEHKQPDFLAMNPQGLIPVLELDELAIPQSLAILEYLDETVPRPARLLPERPASRAIVRAMAQSIACDVHPLNNLRVLEYLKQPLGHDDASVQRWIQHWIAEGFRGLEDMIARYSGDGAHCFGSTVSLADVCLVPQVYNARRFETDLTPYPCLTRVAEQLARHPAFAGARPEAQPDAE
jgi:maleylpyruvate isomerase